jgi:hypothetical protein
MSCATSRSLFCKTSVTVPARALTVLFTNASACAMTIAVLLPPPPPPLPAGGAEVGAVVGSAVGSAVGACVGAVVGLGVGDCVAVACGGRVAGGVVGEAAESEESPLQARVKAATVQARTSSRDFTVSSGSDAERPSDRTLRLPRADVVRERLSAAGASEESQRRAFARKSALRQARDERFLDSVLCGPISLDWEGEQASALERPHRRTEVPPEIAAHRADTLRHAMGAPWLLARRHFDRMLKIGGHPDAPAKEAQVCANSSPSRPDTKHGGHPHTPAEGSM